MAVTYGFFNSVSGDRTYNADQMSEYFKGLVSDGVYESVGGALQVLAGTGLSVNVSTGRMIIDSRWLNNDAVLNLTLNAAHVTLNRYTAIVARLDRTNRLISITTKDGSNATNPVKPSMTNTAEVTEKCLAYVYVAAGATSITQSAIEDTRPNNNICGWVTGLITQVDTSQLFLQWQTAYEEFYAQMQSWMTAEQSAFESWYSTLTQELSINTYIEEYVKRTTGTTTQLAEINLDMTGYEYDQYDMFFVYINGCMAVQGVDYTVNTSGTTPKLVFTFSVGSTLTNEVYIKVLKSVIGQRAAT